jgi:2-dehydro-3-deoxyphosphogluconate aldolase/(4S)-4-hydroxy-2-oxoglutarate aldolase
MDKKELYLKFEQLKVVPVIKIDNADDTIPLCEALIEGGLPCAEITFRTLCAPAAIRKASNIKEILVGAGTVLTVDTVKQAVDCGAIFIVAPGFNPKVVEYCIKNQIPVVPGIATPTEIEMALDMGVDVVKFFPSEAMGGLKILKAISAPYGKVKYVPTGGINEKNLADYLRFEKTLACGGTWIANSELINAKAFDKIKETVVNAVKVVETVKKETQKK